MSGGTQELQQGCPTRPQFPSCLVGIHMEIRPVGYCHRVYWEMTMTIGWQPSSVYLNRHTYCERSYKELTNCTYLVAEELKCYWPNQFVDEFFIGVHKFYFRNCSLSGRSPKDPPNNILGPMIVVPIIVTLLMTVLVVWRSKRSEGIV
ncbi:RAMP1 protein, partial [Polypterus senegalus]